MCQWDGNGVWERMRDHGCKRAALQRAAVTARERRNGRETRICTELFKLMLINNSTYILAFFLWWCFLYTNATVYYIIWFHSFISMVLIVLRYSQQIQFFWKIPSFFSLLVYLWAQWGGIWQPAAFSCATSMHFPVRVVHDRVQIMQNYCNTFCALTIKKGVSFWKINSFFKQANLTVRVVGGRCDVSSLLCWNPVGVASLYL